jgi:hypothetical protein
MFERSPGDANQSIDGHALRMRVERGELMEQADAIALRLAEADDPSAANGYSCFSD